MRLIEDSGRIAIVEIDVIRWHMSSEEYYKMAHWSFHMWPHNLKRLNPQPHSCARCIHRPFQFQDTKKREHAYRQNHLVRIGHGPGRHLIIIAATVKRVCGNEYD